MKGKPTLIFMGTPEFACPSLEGLHERGYPVSCVVTRPDRPGGRGRRLSPSPVKVLAEKEGYPILQPASLRKGAFLDEVRRLKPDAIIVVAFGALLPRALLEIPGWGVINIHASLLPKYRGPAPIQWAIINGETETGVTAMQMDEGLDTGDILGVAKTPVFKDDTAQTLHDRLSRMGAALLLETLEKRASNTLTPVPQDHERATYAPMLKKSDGRIDWHLPARVIERRIRGLMPWPGAFTVFQQKVIRIFKAAVEPGDGAGAPGTVLESEGVLKVATAKGVLCLLEVQAASGKRLPVADFLRGTPVPKGSLLS